MAVKRFANFLVSGKLALGTMATPFAGSTYDVIAEENLLPADGTHMTTAIDQPLDSREIHVAEINSDPQLSLQNLLPTGAYGGIEVTGDAATISLPGPECGVVVAEAVDVVINGVTPSETVFVAISSSLDDSVLQSRIGAGFRLGGAELKILTHFPPRLSVDSTLASVEFRIDLADLPAAGSETFYLQVISFPEGVAVGDWRNARFSSVESISIQEQECSGAY